MRVIKVPRLFVVVVFLLGTFFSLPVGCSSASKPPAPDDPKVEKEIKELNAARQKEWGK